MRVTTTSPTAGFQRPTHTMTFARRDGGDWLLAADRVETGPGGEPAATEVSEPVAG